MMRPWTCSASWMRTRVHSSHIFESPAEIDQTHHLGTRPEYEDLSCVLRLDETFHTRRIDTCRLGHVHDEMNEVEGVTQFFGASGIDFACDIHFPVPVGFMPSNRHVALR